MQPLLLIVFNNVSRIERLVGALRSVAPGKIYVAADGPRSHIAGEKERCAEVINCLKENIDWPCSLFLQINTENLGCDRQVPAAVDWFFENERQGIILEDDCIPGCDFFKFCDEALNKVNFDHRLFWVNGSNLGFRSEDNAFDVAYLSRYPLSWGWATTRDRWSHLRRYIDLTKPLLAFNEIMTSVSGSGKISASLYWHANFRYAYAISNWDFRITYALWCLNGYALVPSVNLISNIGTDPEAFHGAGKNDPRFHLPTGSWDFDLVNMILVRCLDFDAYLESFFYRVSSPLIVRLYLLSTFPSLRTFARRMRGIIRRL